MTLSNRDRVFEILRQYYHRKGKTVRLQTTIVYTNKILKIYKLLDVKDITTTEYFMDVEKIKLFLEINFPNLNSRCTYLSALLVWLHSLQVHINFIKKYQELLFEITNEKKIQQKIKIQNNILKINCKTILDLKIKYNSNFENILKNKNKKKLQEYLIYNLYCGEFIAPVRSDFNKMKIVKEYKEELSKKFNYYDTTNNQFIFRNYKTSGRYGDVVVKCPDELAELIDKIAPLISHEDFLIINLKKLKPYSNNSFAKIVQRVFDGSTICDLRKYYLSGRFSELHEVLRKLKENARCMMNSSDICLSHYIYELQEELKKE